MTPDVTALIHLAPEHMAFQPSDGVVGFIERFAIDEEAGDLAFASHGDEFLLGVRVG